MGIKRSSVPAGSSSSLYAYAHIVIAFLLLGNILYGDDLDKARDLERAGDKSEAVALYGHWVETNRKDSRAPDVLRHSITLFDQPLEAIDFLNNHVEMLPIMNRSLIFALMAELETALGLLQAASRHLVMAIEAGGKDMDLWHLRHLTLRISMGQNIRRDALDLMRTARSKKIVAESGLLAAIALAREGNPEEALIELYQLIKKDLVLPATWLKIAQLQAELNNQAGAQEAIAHLDRDFPKSVHLYVAQFRIFEWESPSTLMGRVSSFPGPIQIGAFTKRDYATLMRDRLEKDRFIAWLEYADNLWKVMVHDPDGQAASRLQSLGYGTSVRW